MAQAEQFGCKTVFDVAPACLSPQSPAELRERLPVNPDNISQNGSGVCTSSAIPPTIVTTNHTPPACTHPATGAITRHEKIAVITKETQDTRTMEAEHINQGLATPQRPEQLARLSYGGIFDYDAKVRTPANGKRLTGRPRLLE